jgi:uncharacterized membrane protein
MLRFGRAIGPSGEGSVLWLLKRNCSISPRQLLAFFATLCAVSLAIGAFFWWQGAPLVLPFAGVELAAVALSLFIYARHAADREQLVLRPGVLEVECSVGRRVDRVEFAPAWVRVEPTSGDHSLIELSGEGKRVAIGRFVRPELRRALADELRASLRRSGTATPPEANES